MQHDRRDPSPLLTLYVLVAACIGLGVVTGLAIALAAHGAMLAQIEAAL
ncbi:MAG TPA: hypothetical protein PKD10_16090 [Paracoccaceae bacterium]|nr:hypothetical protein [Paracoccaceae bacterium]HMO73144.1 hypothetical protein [Paracoccaceae bacterium]